MTTGARREITGDRPQRRMEVPLRKNIFAAAIVALLACAAAAPLAAQQSTAPTTAVRADQPQGIGTPVGVPVAIVQQPAQIAVGSIAGDILQWIAVVFGPVISGAAVMLATKWLKKWGVDIKDADRARLDDLIQNGIANAAQAASVNLTAMPPVAVRNQLVASAVEYAKAHGADTLKSLGAPDPNDPKVIEALRARAADQINKVVASLTPDVVPGPPKV